MPVRAARKSISESASDSKPANNLKVVSGDVDQPADEDEDDEDDAEDLDEDEYDHKSLWAEAAS